VLLPVYAAIAAAIIFYLLIPIFGAFVLRGQWRRFRARVAELALAPILRYRDLADAEREGRTRAGVFRLQGTIEAIEGVDKVWVKGKDVSALVDLSRAPLYVLAPGSPEMPPEAGSIEHLRWSSVSALVEGTDVFVAGVLAIEGGRPVFVDLPDEALLAICHDGKGDRLLSRLIAGGRAPNEYWNYFTLISMAFGLVVISVILLLLRTSIFPTLRALVFLAGLSPVLPFAPPGLAFFLFYNRLWRRALAARTARDLLRLPLRSSGSRGAAAFLKRPLVADEALPKNATRIALQGRGESEARALTLYSPVNTGDPLAESFIIEGDPDTQIRKAERGSFFYATASGLAIGLAVLVNFALAFLLWRSSF
jgi:hypothetical protein